MCHLFLIKATRKRTVLCLPIFQSPGLLRSISLNSHRLRNKTDMKKENLEKITQLRHELHMYPELSMQESGTLKIIRQFLRENTSLQVADCGGWCYAVKRGTTGKAGSGLLPDVQPGEKNGRQGRKKIAFRADMDALPIMEKEDLPYHSRNRGVSHKCGHDGHCAALCGLALELDQMETEKDVYLIFQPGEETGQGALLCRDLLKKEGISEIFAFHNLGGFPENSMVFRDGLTQPASEGLEMHFSGKTSHASAPGEGINPAEVIAKTVLFARDLAGRVKEGMALCTVTGIGLGTGDFGISPGEGRLCLTLRAEYEAEMKRMEKDLLDYARGLSEPLGIHFSYAIRDYFPETRNDSRSLIRIREAAQKAGLQTIPMDRMWRASEDFGWYLKECPGAMVYIGNGEKYPALHTEEYDFNDRILETAVDLFLELV